MGEQSLLFQWLKLGAGFLFWNRTSVIIKKKMKSVAIIKFCLPKSKRSGATTYSIMFIIPTKSTWTAVHNFDWILLNTQTAIPISKVPMTFVNSIACFSLRILSTICWWRGTRFNTLQNRPLASQIREIKSLRKTILFNFFVRLFKINQQDFICKDSITTTSPQF